MRLDQTMHLVLDGPQRLAHVDRLRPGNRFDGGNDAKILQFAQRGIAVAPARQRLALGLDGVVTPSHDLLQMSELQKDIRVAVVEVDRLPIGRERLVEFCRLLEAVPGLDPYGEVLRKLLEVDPVRNRRLDPPPCVPAPVALAAGIRFRRRCIGTPQT